MSGHLGLKYAYTQQSKKCLYFKWISQLYSVSLLVSSGFLFRFLPDNFLFFSSLAIRNALCRSLVVSIWWLTMVSPWIFPCILASQYIIFEHFIFYPGSWLLTLMTLKNSFLSAQCFWSLRKTFFFSSIISFGIFFSKSWTVYVIYCFYLSLWPSSGEMLNLISFFYCQTLVPVKQNSVLLF